MNQETFVAYRRYQYCLRQQKLQQGKTFRGYELVSISPHRRGFLKRKYSVYVVKNKIKKQVVYLVKIGDVLLQIYLNGLTIAPTTKDVT